MIRVKSIAYIGAGIYVPRAVPFKIDIAVARKHPKLKQYRMDCGSQVFWDFFPFLCVFIVGVA